MLNNYILENNDSLNIEFKQKEEKVIMFKI
jgi:hypothetical protein